MTDCARCPRAKRKNRLLKKLADVMESAVPLFEDNCSNAAVAGAVELVEEARKEAER